MPQISQLAATYASQIFWLLVTFGVVFFVVGRGMLPKVQATIDQRDGSIAADLAAAKAARDAADVAEAQWHQRDLANRERAQGIVSEARARAAKASEATLATANAAQAARVAAGEAEIGAAALRATTDIEALSAELTQDIVQRVSGLLVSADEAQGAVKAVLADG